MKIVRVDHINAAAVGKDIQLLPPPQFQIVTRTTHVPIAAIPKMEVNNSSNNRRRRHSSTTLPRRRDSADSREYLQYPMSSGYKLRSSVDDLNHRNRNGYSNNSNNQMVFPKYEDHLNTLPLAAEIRALRRIQSSENVDLNGYNNNNNISNGRKVYVITRRNSASHGDLHQSSNGVQRHQSVREPMMSMVPEEASIVSSSHRDSSSPDKDYKPSSNSRSSRAAETISQIKTVGSVAGEHVFEQDVMLHTLPRSAGKAAKINSGIFSRGNSLRQQQQQHNTLPRNTTFNSNNSRNYPNNNNNILVREDGDGAGVSDEFQDQEAIEFLPDYSDSEDDNNEECVVGNGNGRIVVPISTIYRVGSLVEFPCTEGSGKRDNKNFKLTQNLNRSKSEGVLFEQSDNSLLHQDLGLLNGFGSTGALNHSNNNNNNNNNNGFAGGMKNWFSGGGWGGVGGGGGGGINGAANINNAKIDDKQSTLSRYWTMDRSLQRRLQKTNYQHIKRLCRDRGQLFDDADFPPVTRSIYKNKKPPMHPLTWLRPHEICQRPKFIAEGATRFDVEQGEQGDPWLLAAVSSLTLTPRFLDRVVPPDQNFEHGYCGVFRFRFWHFGDWIEVLVDDRLPTYKGRLVYMHSTDPAEFWAALLEKAYAKLYGSYEALHQGFTTKALQDLTGGIVQSFSLSSQDRLLTYQVLNSAVPRSTLLIASINIDTRHDSKRQLRLRNGLITRHAYSVTGLARVRGQLGDTHLVRLRNPWGKGEWNGPWSERSWEWDSLAERDKELLSARVRNEGEFWIAFDDFAKQFSHLDLVHVGPDDWMSESALHSKKPWRAVLARRRWRSGYNAGGSPQHVETTAMNPQFHIQIPRTNNVKCHVVVSVTQQYETNPGGEGGGGGGGNSSSGGKVGSKRKKRKLHHIGFAVYEVPPHMTRLTPIYVAEHQPLDVTNHSVAREVVTFFTLPPGDYIVVPQTNVPNCDGKFLLRILTDEQSNIWEVNEDNMLFRNVLAEFEESFKYSESRILLGKLVSKYPPEIDASILQKILRGHWKSYLLERPSLELCKSLVMLRDYNISGRVNLMEIPLLLHLLHFWRNAYVKYLGSGSSSGAKSSSFNLRLILWEAGITVSNKVLECLVLRFAKNKLLSSEAYVTVMVRLHLAHERYHSIDTKMKGNPLSLEEMILMTIYS